MNVAFAAVVEAAFVPFEFDESLLGLVLDMIYEPVEMAWASLLLVPSELEVLHLWLAQRVEPIVLERYQMLLPNLS